MVGAITEQTRYVETRHVGNRIDRLGRFLDSAGMYLRVIYELEVERKDPPTRSRVGARLGLSRPTVGQQITRMSEDGLVFVSPRQRLHLTGAGRQAAEVVVRKHRLAERMLVDIIGIEWEFAHTDASLWQHVLSDAVERKLLDLLEDPSVSPYGHSIPALSRLRRRIRTRPPAEHKMLVVDLHYAAQEGATEAVVEVITEEAQGNPGLLKELRRLDILPGRSVEIAAGEAGRCVVSTPSGRTTMDTASSRAIRVTPRYPATPDAAATR